MASSSSPSPMTADSISRASSPRSASSRRGSQPRPPGPSRSPPAIPTPPTDPDREEPSVLRPAIVVALPPTEATPVCLELETAGFEVILADGPVGLEAILDTRADIALAILDGEADDELARAHATMRRGGRPKIPALTVVSPRAFERLATRPDESGDEYFTRPYSTDAIRWRVEAMVIRRQTVDDGSGPVLQGGIAGAGGWGRRALTVAVFNPTGGVGKTTVATNLAAALQV